MAAIRSLLLRRGAFSLLRTRSTHSAASIPPAKAPASSSARPWEWNAIRHRSKSSTNAYEEAYEDSSANRKGVVEDYKFAYEDFKPRELDITEIEGCDMKHWLITVEFPKDPRPSPEDMVRFYEETVAKSLNISLEQAKKKIYACSTSNYTGFHVEVSEQESEKFRGKPGVVFILPDSYVDKEKKEYGGDKYINGIIIPRPRPNMNGRTRFDLKTDRLDDPVPASRPNQQSQTPPHSSHLRIPPPNSQQEPVPSPRTLPNYSHPSQKNPTHYAPPPPQPSYHLPGPQNHGLHPQGPIMNYRPNHYPGPSQAPPNYYPGPPANYAPYPRTPYLASYYQDSYYGPPCYNWQGGYVNAAPNGYGPGLYPYPYPYYYYHYPYQSYVPSQQGYYGESYQNYGPQQLSPTHVPQQHGPAYGPQQHSSAYGPQQHGPAYASQQHGPAYASQQHGPTNGPEQQDGGGYNQGQGPPHGRYWK